MTRALLGGLLIGAALAVVPAAAAADDCRSGYVALTFDDGPSSAYTPRILDVLRDRGAIATFFVNGYRIEDFPQLLQREYEEGHAIANHGFSHRRLNQMGPDRIAAELTRTRDLAEELGVPMLPIVRPPYGAGGSRVTEVAESLGMTTMLWTVGSGDSGGASASRIAGIVLHNLAPGANILLHDAINNSYATLRALPTILDGMARRGYCTGVLDSYGEVVPFRESPVSDPPPACSLAEGCDEIGYVDNASLWHVLDSATGAEEATFYFGDTGDIPLVGDWDCDGFDSAGVYRPSSGEVHLAAGPRGSGPVTTFTFGNPGDVPLVGDFDGDGCDTLGVYRASVATMFLSNRLNAGAAEMAFSFGNPGDSPLIGDFDGDGDDDVGLHRPSEGRIYLRLAATGGNADVTFLYGETRDVVMAGDFDGDAVDSVVAYRWLHNAWLIRLANSSGAADHTIYFGQRRDSRFVGHFGP